MFATQRVKNVDLSIYTNPQVKERVARGIPFGNPNIANFLWNKEVKTKIDFMKSCFKAFYKFAQENNIPKADEWFVALQRGCKHLKSFLESVCKNEESLVKEFQGRLDKQLCGRIINTLKRKSSDYVNGFYQEYMRAVKVLISARNDYYQSLGKDFESLASDVRPIGDYKVGAYTAIVGKEGKQFQDLPVYIYKKVICVEDGIKTGDYKWSFISPTLFKKGVDLKMKAQSRVLGGSATLVDVMGGVRNMNLEQKANDDDDL